MTDAAVPALRSASPRWSRLLAYAAGPVDFAWLAAFRILFGLTLAVSMLRFIGYGWVNTFFVTPRFHFKYWGFSWVRELPAPLMHALFYVLLVLALCVAAGLFFRVTAWLFALGFAYLELIDVSTYLNHYYLAALLAFLLALSPAHRAWSLDVLRSRGPRAVTVPRFWLLLFRAQLAVVYGFAGLAKAQPDWLLHAQPLRIWLSSRTDLPLLGPLLAQDAAAPLFSWAGFLFDSTIVWWLLVPRVRPFAYAVLVVFHLVTRALFPIGMFPVIMITATLVFFPPDWPRRLLARLRAKPPDTGALAGVIAAPELRQVSSVGPVTVLLGALYVALQVALPFRHVLYPGSVLWHEQGMRWSWRVMVREKNGSVVFLVRDPRTGKEWEVSPHRYLTRLQEREMSGQPDLILQLAHHVRDDFEERLRTRLEVRAEAFASLNGRPLAYLVDPHVDLARVEDGLAAASFITATPPSTPLPVRAVASGDARRY